MGKKTVKIEVPAEDAVAVRRFLSERRRLRKQIVADERLIASTVAWPPKQASKCTWGEPGRLCRKPVNPDSYPCSYCAEHQKENDWYMAVF